MPFVIIDPNSGAGTTVNGDYVRLIGENERVGIRSLGYLRTMHGERKLEDIKAEIDRYMDFYPGITGFYFDEVSASSDAHVALMKDVYEYVKAKNANALVIANQTNGLTKQEMANYADIHVISESSSKGYVDNYKAPTGAWENNPANADRIMHMVYNVDSDDYDKVIALSRTRNAGWLFVTTDRMPNPYNDLPDSFAELVNKINNLGMPRLPFNPAPAPRPSASATPSAAPTATAVASATPSASATPAATAGNNANVAGNNGGANNAKPTVSATPSATAAANNAGNPFINRANNAANNLQNALQNQQDQLDAIGGVKASARRDANGKVTVSNGKGAHGATASATAKPAAVAGRNSGLMLDVARQFYTVEELKGFINDVAAANGKFFHLHLSDNENFALESEILGQTAEKATRSRDGVYTGPLGNNFYSKEQIRQLAQYASSRGVELVPEVDLPGHSAFIYDLLSKSNPKLAKQAFGGDSQAATKFAQDLYLEVAKQFTGSRHFHMGGDDFTGAVEQNASYISYVNANASALKAKGFTPRIWNDGVLVSSLGKLDKAVEITYHVSGGEKASITNLIGSGYKVINYGGRTDNAVEGTALAVWSKNGKAVSGDNLRTKLQRQIAPASNGDEDASNPNGGANKR